MYRCTGLPSTCTPRYDRTVIDTVSLQNEIWSIDHDHTGGTFVLDFAGSMSGALAWDISNAALETAIEGLTGLTDVTVTGTTGNWTVEVIGDGPGRIRLAGLRDYSADSLHGFIETAAAPGAVAKTDGWSAYPGAPKVSHDPHVIGAMAAHIVLPWVHRVFANLKTWALGVTHGLRRQHLQSYLDAFTFRFNRRRTRHAAFRSLLRIGMQAKPVTYKMLIAPETTG